MATTSNFDSNLVISKKENVDRRYMFVTFATVFSKDLSASNGTTFVSTSTMPS